MQAIRVHTLEGIEALRFESADLPAPGAGEIKVAVHAAGCNFADTLQINIRGRIKRIPRDCVIGVRLTSPGS